VIILSSADYEAEFKEFKKEIDLAFDEYKKHLIEISSSCDLYDSMLGFSAFETECKEKAIDLIHRYWKLLRKEPYGKSAEPYDYCSVKDKELSDIIKDKFNSNCNCKLK
jgi:hypothetical protein